MEIPVYENSARVGTLRVTRQGLYTLFETRLPAALPPLPRGGCPSAHTGAGGYSSSPPLTRLWLADESGAAAPLGLLEPRGEGRVLCRRLTRLDCRALPARPVCALVLPADAPAVGEGLAPPAASGARPTAGRASPAPTAQSAHVPVGAGALVGPPSCHCEPVTDEPGVAIRISSPPNRPAAEETDKVNLAEGQRAGGPGQCRGPQAALAMPGEASPWRARPDGSLIDPARRLLALPWAGGPAPAPARKISVGGREYLLFRY